MRHSPSISPANRLDRDIYLVLEDFSSGAAWRETDEDRTDYRTLISDLLTGQYDHPLRVVAFNPLEGWSRDASEDVAHKLEQRVAEGHEVSELVREFIERFTGRRATVAAAARVLRPLFRSAVHRCRPMPKMIDFCLPTLGKAVHSGRPAKVARCSVVLSRGRATKLPETTAIGISH